MLKRTVLMRAAIPESASCFVFHIVSILVSPADHIKRKAFDHILHLEVHTAGECFIISCFHAAIFFNVHCVYLQVAIVFVARLYLLLVYTAIACVRLRYSLLMICSVPNEFSRM